ncbi:hypothetical protein N4T57_06010 [Campylobacter hepaticus]|nr:hypothetical protein [Campylobacter hepaticus]MCZ0772690.1 hypothetical protein [Campylobacter hepaticus]MCZ0774158.1 hypothetical protein [Campylobacter hepaticus]MCZ0775410.1 hypothetical protein [Campylobacter hepaticus]MDX2323832.1 hypothetical protein [Campylobacter hepaticus]MDX2331696.1 hypothetical protein [Campylobacter hepaticus]
MIKILVLLSFIFSFLLAQNFLNHQEDNNITKEENILPQQKRIKIPTH